MRKPKVNENTLAGWSDIILNGINTNPAQEEIERVNIAVKLILLRSQGVITEGMTLEQIIKILTKELTK